MMNVNVRRQVQDLVSQRAFEVLFACPGATWSGCVLGGQGGGVSAGAGWSYECVSVIRVRLQCDSC